MNKRNELDALIDIHRPSVVGIVEVKPKNQRFNDQECEIALPGFESFHNLESKGRGICLHIKSELNPSCKDVKTDFEECMFVDCKLSNSETWTIGFVYRSPSSSEDNNQNPNQLLRTVTEAKPQHLLVLGDFNFPEIDWDRELSRASTNHPASKFLTVFKDTYLIQHQRGPTRLRDGQHPTLDDLVLTNQQDLVNKITTASALGKSDHATLLINIVCNHQKPKKPAQPNFLKADYSLMGEDLDCVI
ncbi:hypothetical protein HAZT_HAZT000416 [Hyalella azteca]|uniref:Endonuclease/exonuclease/phosphatase domain-containing protein n=1 Tax=Hyalella azteca TaxID=294128 RepID=A0A6A0HBH8_HYAAZ|nr:hypothetical protein HAZT_HAZT000416 [Hyalella azteca]